MSDEAILKETLCGEFNKAFGILDDAIASFTTEQWCEGSPPFNGPGRVTLHMLQCAHFYTDGDKKVFAGDPKPVWQMTVEELPTARQMLDYSAAAHAKTMSWLESINGLAERNQARPEVSNAEAIVYALRHLQHHIGELCAYQKHAGIDPAQWQ